LKRLQRKNRYESAGMEIHPTKMNEVLAVQIKRVSPHPYRDKTLKGTIKTKNKICCYAKHMPVSSFETR
jgi:hypothetical protein